MVTGQMPPFTDYAKDILCQDPAKFSDIYGTHFVKGQIKGASIEMELKISAKSSKSVDEVSAGLAFQGSKMGAGVNASSDIEAYLNQSSEVSSSHTVIKIKGGNRGEDIVQNLDISKASDAILSFANKSN